MGDSFAGVMGQEGPPPLGWPVFKVVAVHEEYLGAKAWDGAAGWGDTIDIAKPPNLRESQTGGVSYGVVDELILAAPLLQVVGGDGGGDDVVCQWVQFSFAFPAGEPYQVWSWQPGGTMNWDYPRLHP